MIRPTRSRLFRLLCFVPLLSGIRGAYGDVLLDEPLLRKSIIAMEIIHYFFYEFDDVPQPDEYDDWQFFDAEPEQPDQALVSRSFLGWRHKKERLHWLFLISSAHAFSLLRWLRKKLHVMVFSNQRDLM